MHPGGEQVLGWGVLGSVPASKLDEMLTQLDMASELSIAYGGKRYLSGFITFDTPGALGGPLRRPAGRACARPSAAGIRTASSPPGSSSTRA